uniref:Translation initiation factor IF-2 n=1 Tax=Haemonchus contortus TaxID=6289 RepID=A0A7I4YGU7_HAECO
MRQTERTNWPMDKQTNRPRRQTGKRTPQSQTGTDIHRTPTDSKTGRHRHIQTKGGRCKDEQKRTRTNRHTKTGTGTDKGDRRGQTWTDTHPDVACKTRTAHTGTDGTGKTRTDADEHARGRGMQDKDNTHKDGQDNKKT